MLLLLAVMGFACFNTRNNLLYLMFSIGIASVLATMAAGWLTLRRLTVQGDGLPDLYAGTVCREALRLTNEWSWLHAYGVEIEELDFPGRAPRTVVGHLGARRSATAVLEKAYPRRGVFETQRLSLSTRHPFGFFEASREVRLQRRLTVYPAVRRVDISFVFQDSAGMSPHQQRRGESEELLRLRNYALGDNLHHVHWKASAKLGRLVVRDFAAYQQRKFCLILDNYLPQAHDSEDFEAMVSAAASLASHLASHELGFRFVSADEVFLPDCSPEHLRGILSYLATVRTSAAPRYDLAAAALDSVRADEMVLFVGPVDAARAQFVSPNLHRIDPYGVMIGDGSSGDRLSGQTLMGAWTA